MENFDQHPPAPQDTFSGIESKIDGVMKEIDNGNIFKSIIVVLFRLISYGVFVSGSLACIVNMFGDDGYFSNFESMEGMKQFTSVIGLLIGLALCLAGIYLLFLFIKKRTDQLADAQYEGLLHYIFKSTLSSLIIIYGEALSLLVLLVGILSLVAVLLSSYVYFPLAEMFSGLGVMGGLSDFNRGGIWIQGFNEYSTYFESLKTNGVGALGTMAISGFVLISTYVLKEVYLYLIQLIIKLIEFSFTKTGILILFIAFCLSYIAFESGVVELLKNLF